MRQARFIIDFSTARQGPAFVQADCHVLIDEFAFPDPKWNDNIVVVLGWWTGQAAKLLNGETDSVEIGFMEGPYAVQTSLAGQGVLRMRCLEVRLSTEVRYESLVEVQPFVEDLIMKADATATLCKQKGWWTKDVPILEVETAYLKSVQKSRK